MSARSPRATNAASSWRTSRLSRKATSSSRTCWSRRTRRGSAGPGGMAYRVDKVAHQLREELSDILARLADPRVGMVTIVEVDVSPDLRNALVKVSSIGDDAQRRARIAALEHARGFIKREL